jgi:hypothetical protein
MLSGEVKSKCAEWVIADIPLWKSQTSLSVTLTAVEVSRVAMRSRISLWASHSVDS